jgi:hypothetical protein
MLTAALSANLLNQTDQTYFQQRRTDLQQLGKDLQSGNLSASQQDFTTLQSLGQSGPLSGGNAFAVSARQQDFTAIGQALQSGNLSSAQQAYSQLESTFNHHVRVAPPVADGGGSTGSTTPTSTSPTSTSPTSTSPTSTSPTSSGAPASSEIIVNLGAITPGEQVNINIANGANGSDQITIGVAGQGSTPEQITLNLNASSNQELVLNLFNSTTSTSSQGSGLSVNG